MTRKAQALSAEDECRDILGVNKFEVLEAQVDPLRLGDDRRDVVFTEIRRLALSYRGYAVLDPKWCKRRDRVLAKIEKAINDLKEVLKDSEWNRLGEPGEDWNETWTGGLEREYRKLVEPEVLDDGSVTTPFLKLSRVGLRWVSPTGGAPPKGIGTARDNLRKKAGLSEIEAQNLLLAAGFARERKT